MENQKTCDGTLSADEFYIAANTLCDQWKSANTSLPDWTWIPCKRMPSGSSYYEDGYLSLESIYHIKSSFASNILIKDLLNSQNLSKEGGESVDCATLVQVPSIVIHTYDFHITYSHSYRDPVLYFNGHRTDGQPLDLDEIQQDLPEYSRKLLTESKWTFITVEEHPYLHQPWYMIHPCGTSDWMKLLLRGRADAANHLISWLSVVGQAVGLRVPISLEQVQQQLRRQEIHQVRANEVDEVEELPPTDHVPLPAAATVPVPPVRTPWSSRDYHTIIIVSPWCPECICRKAREDYEEED